eukprot:2600804-Amphidinium_carterae.1
MHGKGRHNVHILLCTFAVGDTMHLKNVKVCKPNGLTPHLHKHPERLSVSMDLAGTYHDWQAPRHVDSLSLRCKCFIDLICMQACLRIPLKVWCDRQLHHQTRASNGLDISTQILIKCGTANNNSKKGLGFVLTLHAARHVGEVQLRKLVHQLVDGLAHLGKTNKLTSTDGDILKGTIKNTDTCIGSRA